MFSQGDSLFYNTNTVINSKSIPNTATNTRNVVLCHVNKMETITIYPHQAKLNAPVSLF